MSQRYSVSENKMTKETVEKPRLERKKKKERNKDRERKRKDRKKVRKQEQMLKRRTSK